MFIATVDIADLAAAAAAAAPAPPRLPLLLEENLRAKESIVASGTAGRCSPRLSPSAPRRLGGHYIGIPPFWARWREGETLCGVIPQTRAETEPVTDERRGGCTDGLNK